MNREKLLYLVLTLHLTGLILMAGTSIIDYVTYRLFWKIYQLEKKTSKGLVTLMATYSRIIGIGAALLILSGFGMMFITRGVFGEQRWFRIKFILVLLLVANGIFSGRRLGMRQRVLLSTDGYVLDAAGLRVKSRLKIFYLLQFSLFILIIVLSVFKFN